MLERYRNFNEKNRYNGNAEFGQSMMKKIGSSRFRGVDVKLFGLDIIILPYCIDFLGNIECSSCQS